MAFQVTIVPPASGAPDQPYNAQYLEDFIVANVSGTLIQILENGPLLVLVHDS